MATNTKQIPGLQTECWYKQKRMVEQSFQEKTLEHTSFKLANDLGLSRHAVGTLFQIFKAALKGHEKSMLEVKRSVKSITLFNL